MCSTVAISIWVCILLDDKPSITNLSEIQAVTPDVATFLKVYGIISFQFDIHPMLMTIEVDMERRPKISSAVLYGILCKCVYCMQYIAESHSINIALFSTLATVFLCAITTFLAAFKYGTTITANVLDILPRGNLLYATIFLVTLQLCLSNAVGHSALYQHIEDVLHVPRSKKPSQFASIGIM